MVHRVPIKEEAEVHARELAAAADPAADAATALCHSYQTSSVSCVSCDACVTQQVQPPGEGPSRWP